MADYGIRRYRIRGALLRRGLLDGLSLEGDALSAAAEGSVFLPALDSALPDCAWGRVSLRCTLGPESMLTIRAFASDQDVLIRKGETVRINSVLLDPDIPRAEKERLFTLAEGMERSGAPDVLLKGQRGRYLWLWLEISGGDGGRLEDLRVYVPGDNFFRTLPQVYQTDGDFLERWLSIFSTMYQELQEEIDGIPDLLDIDTAPEALLPMFASWMGLEPGNLTMEELRRLLKAAPELLPRKGTRWAVERVVKLLVPEEVYVVERNLLSPGQRDTLYGSTPYDFTVLLARSRDERLQMCLEQLIGWFKPARAQCRIVFLAEAGGLDAFTYMDINGTMLQSAPGNLDDGRALAGTTYLK